KVAEGGARFSLDHNIGWHAGNELNTMQALELALIERYSGGVILCISRLVVQKIRRYDQHGSGELRGGALVETREPDDDWLTRMDLVNVLRGKLGFQNQSVAGGHDLHQFLARGDDTADCMQCEVENPPPQRCPYLKPFQSFCRASFLRFEPPDLTAHTR